MAEIHLARVTGAAGFEKLVVVKRLLPDLAEEKEFVEQFKDEARLAASFSHQNIVTTFDFGETDGNFYLAMEYVEGKNLRRIADSLEKRGKRLPEAAAVHIIAEACRGLGPLLQPVHGNTEIELNFGGSGRQLGSPPQTPLGGSPLFAGNLRLA